MKNIKMQQGNKVWKTGLKIGKFWLSWHKGLHVYTRTSIVKAQKQELYA